MGGFAILTNRKRAIIALAHAVVFCVIATWQLVAGPIARGMGTPASASTGTWVLCGIYFLVSSVLLWLLVISRGWMEKTYFAFCTISAASGLLRTLAGDSAFPVGRHLRVVMLMSAILVGLLITRAHSAMAESGS
ncbi:MAG TPA: hypothetical protein VLT90_08930 [Terriglobales bacterium]|nr:hypothetical protein [Terriglobales bacterium]